MKTLFVNIYNGAFDIYLHAKDLLIKSWMGSPQILSIDETLDRVIAEKCSVSRYGDGELKIAVGEAIRFQEYDSELERRLREILVSNQKNHLVCVTGIFENIDWMMPRSYQYTWHILARYRKKWMNLIDKNKVYGNTFMTRCYIDFKDKSETPRWFEKIKRIWNQESVILVEGEQSRLGCCNDLFENAKSIERILAPAKSAFKSYNEILNCILQQDKNKLVLIALGPTATVLAFDLTKYGYRAIDIGHVDIEYEWFLRGATEKIKIEGKYTNEADGGDDVCDSNDSNYYTQIIAKVI